MQDFKEKTLEQIVAELCAEVADLKMRLTIAEKEVNTSGVYLDGVPDYIKDYVTERRKARGENN